MRIFFYGGRNSGMAVLLAVQAVGHELVGVVPVDAPVEETAKKLGIRFYKPKDINISKIIDLIKQENIDLLLCCHGRQIIKKDLLDVVPAVNIHPLLFKYPGAAPISRMIEDGETRASVAVHWMTEYVDQGEVIVENFMEVKGRTEVEVYNELYPLYVTTCIEALNIIESKICPKST